MVPLLADYTPLIDSLQALWPNSGDYTLWALVPLTVAISIVYKATKLDDLRELPAATLRLSLTILVSMALAAVALYGIVWSVTHHWFG
jgi:hypothetical protein